MLAAADGLFAETETPGSVSMDDIAAAAGVGKGTLFRAFGNRTTLINEVFEARVAPIRDAVDNGYPPLGPGTEPVTRAVAILNSLLVFKIENRHLGAAMESAGTELFALDYYRWIHATIRALITEATGDDDPKFVSYAAHALISSLRADLNERLLADGAAVADLLAAQAQLIRRVLESD